MCTNKGDNRDAFSNERHEALCISRGQFSRPLSLERSERRGLFFVIAWIFDRTRTSPLQWQVQVAAIDLHRGVWSRNVKYSTNRVKVRTAAAGMHTIDIRTAREMILFRFSLTMWALIL